MEKREKCYSFCFIYSFLCKCDIVYSNTLTISGAFNNVQFFRGCFSEKLECGKQATPPPSSQDVTACIVRGSQTGRTGNVPTLNDNKREDMTLILTISIDYNS
jgi:hypothetical protein